MVTTYMVLLLIWQLDIPMIVIPAKAGIQERTGCRIKSGMTWLVPFDGNVINEDYATLSSIAAIGAFFLTELIPFSMELTEEYISLVPITCPLDAFNTK